MGTSSKVAPPTTSSGASRFPESKVTSLPDLDRQMLDFWRDNDVFSKSLEKPAGAPTFSFYEGPPTANGRPGIHHVMGRTIKDAFCRYKTMKGYRVERKAGWDTHGLPVEIEVEKELGLSGRDQVAEYGIDRYNAACRESVLRYKDVWDDLTVRMGYWVDLDDPYITFQNEYIESVWHLLKTIYERGLLYKGHKIQWYSPGSGTVLSSHEVSLGYEEVQDPSIYVRFPIIEKPGVAFLAWTTTPWTTVSNTALAVGADIDYVQVRVAASGGGRREEGEGRREEGEGRREKGEGESLILARKRLEVLKAEYTVEAEFKGSDLVGLHYTPLYDYFTRHDGAERSWRVVPADYVTTEDGTGIVHTSPAFGADDYATARKEDLPVFCPVDREGRFTDEAPLVAGMWFKDADKVIARDLRERGLMYRHDTYLHNYPHDWRKGTPLMSYPVEGWFIRTTAIRDRLVALNDTINWQPAGIGTGRFGEWLRNNVDWALSRRRFWGTPLPIWESDRPGSDYREIIGSIAELREKCGDQFADDDLDLHRPFVDRLTWPAPDGGTMRRVEDLIDVWFDSGAMPFAQWHYPFENRQRFERSFPADFIAEGVDQTRGWFYTLHAIAALVCDDVAYKNVVVNGLVLDENGEKMSKSKGNAVDPFETLEEHGADVVRWYLMSNAPPWENIRFSEHGLVETYRKFFSTIFNVYGFFATYANVDGVALTDDVVPVAQRPELDRWIVSRLNSTAREVDAALGDYHPTRAARAVEAFVDDLSNWYIRRSRRRFWKKADFAGTNENSAIASHGASTGAAADPHNSQLTTHNSSAVTDDKLTAYQTVFECLDGVARLIAPIAPFTAEWLYQNLKSGADVSRLESESVHTSDFPFVDESSVDVDLERRMELARTIASAVLAIRNACNVNVRQPLAKMLVVTGPKVDRVDVEAMREVVLSEVNVKELDYVDTASGVVSRSARANYKALGKRLGGKMKSAAAAIAALNDEQIADFVESGHIRIEVDRETIELTEGDVEVASEGVDGWVVQQSDGVTVALDPTVDEALLSEGLAREVVNRLQTLRKAADYDVTDRIFVRYHATPRLREAVGSFDAWIRNETLALELDWAIKPDGERVESYLIDDEELTVGIQRARGPAGTTE